MREIHHIITDRSAPVDQVETARLSGIQVSLV
jgi:hypothetical protein